MALSKKRGARQGKTFVCSSLWRKLVCSNSDPSCLKKDEKITIIQASPLLQEKLPAFVCHKVWARSVCLCPPNRPSNVVSHAASKNSSSFLIPQSKLMWWHNVCTGRRGGRKRRRRRRLRPLAPTRLGFLGHKVRQFYIENTDNNLHSLSFSLQTIFLKKISPIVFPEKRWMSCLNQPRATLPL